MPLQSTYHVFIVFQSLKAQARFHFNHRNHLNLTETYLHIC